MTGESKFSRETCSTCQIQSRARSTPLQWPLCPLCNRIIHGQAESDQRSTAFAAGSRPRSR